MKAICLLGNQAYGSFSQTNPHLLEQKEIVCWHPVQLKSPIGENDLRILIQSIKIYFLFPYRTSLETLMSVLTDNLCFVSHSSAIFIITLITCTTLKRILPEYYIAMVLSPLSFFSPTDLRRQYFSTTQAPQVNFPKFSTIAHLGPSKLLLRKAGGSNKPFCDSQVKNKVVGF